MEEDICEKGGPIVAESWNSSLVFILMFADSDIATQLLKDGSATSADAPLTTVGVKTDLAAVALK